MPILDRPAIAVAALGYLTAVLAIGLWATRRTRGVHDFFVAGRAIGLLVTGLATMSAAFSGFVFIGGPGLTYRLGLASLFICLPVGLTAGMLCWVVAKRLRLLAEVRDVLTVPDAILARYRSPVASGLAAVAVVVGAVGYLGAQLLALGVVIEAVFGLRTSLGEASLAIATGAGVLVVLAYAVGGGMVAGVYTDLFQGALMALAALGVFAYAWDAGGGPASVAHAIVGHAAFGPTFLDPLGNLPLATTAGFFFVFTVGTLGQPHMLHKFYMLDDPRKLRWFPAVLGSSQAMCLLIWVGIGVAVPALVARGAMPPLDRPDDAAPLFLLGHVPGWLAGLVFAGVLAAVMSTADSLVNVAAAAVVHDLPKAFGRTVRRELLWSRVAVVAVAAFATLVALRFGDLIALLGTFAFGTFAAALAPAVAIGLNWRRVTTTAAVASIATGLVLNLGLELLARQTWWPSLPKPTFLAPGVLPSAFALAASFLVLFLVTAATRPDPPPDDDVAAVMAM